MRKVLATAWMPQEAWNCFADDFELILPTTPHGSFTREEVEQLLPECQGLFTMNFPCDEELLKLGKMNQLKAVCNFGVGYDNIAWNEATKLGIGVINTPMAVTEATAELAITLMLCGERGILASEQRLRQEQRCKNILFEKKVRALYGKTVGIIGFGRIGRAFAKKAYGLGMYIQYYSSSRASAEVEETFHAVYKPLELLLETSDVITLHVPYKPETHHLINEESFTKMKKDCFLINTSRGAVVDEKGLIRALQEGQISGAGLDVYEFEPEISPELLQLSNVVLLPHIGTMAWDVRIQMVQESLCGMREFLNGKIPDNCINKEAFK